MKIHRFFVEEKIADVAQITITNKDIIHQMKNVLRLREGEQVVLLDNEGAEYFGSLKTLSKEEVIVAKEKINSHTKNTFAINLYFSIPKKDKAEWILQKCTEFGVDNFFPVISDRTEKINLKDERAKIIIKEAAEQSEKVFQPKFHATVKLNDALADLCDDEVNSMASETFYLDIGAEKIDIKEIVDDKNKNINIFVGPEGGWSEKDKEIFSKYNIKSYSLGDFVLRAETASIAIISALKII